MIFFRNSNYAKYSWLATKKRNKKQTKEKQKANKKGTKSKKGSETFKNNSFDKARCYLVYKNCIKVCANNLTIRKI